MASLDWNQVALVAISTTGAVGATLGATAIGHRKTVRRERYAEVAESIDAAVQAFTEALARVDRLSIAARTRDPEIVEPARYDVFEWETRARAAIYSIELRLPLKQELPEAFYDALAALTASVAALDPWIHHVNQMTDLRPLPEFNTAREAAHRAFDQAMRAATLLLARGEIAPVPGRLRLRWTLWRMEHERDRPQPSDIPAPDEAIREKMERYGHKYKGDPE